MGIFLLELELSLAHVVLRRVDDFVVLTIVAFIYRLLQHFPLLPLGGRIDRRLKTYIPDNMILFRKLIPRQVHQLLAINLRLIWAELVLLNRYQRRKSLRRGRLGVPTLAVLVGAVAWLVS